MHGLDDDNGDGDDDTLKATDFKIGKILIFYEIFF